MPPKKKAATASKAVDPEKLTVPKLKAELKKLGLETDGLKAVLVARLKEALAGGGDAPAETPEPKDVPEPKATSKSPAKKSPTAKSPAKGKRAAKDEDKDPEPEPEPEPEPMQVDEPAPAPSPKGKKAKATAAAEADSPAKSPPSKRRKAEPAPAPEASAPAPAPEASAPEVSAPEASAPARHAPRLRGGLTVSAIASDELTKTAERAWRRGEGEPIGAWDESLVAKIYADELRGAAARPRRSACSCWRFRSTSSRTCGRISTRIPRRASTCSPSPRW